MRLVGDSSRLFAVVLVASWLLLVTLPLVLSIAVGQPAQGIPLVGVLVWFVLLRVARWLSPAARADGLLRRGRAAEALAVADHALAVKGRTASTGTRRLFRLNRPPKALPDLGPTHHAPGLRAVALVEEIENLDLLDQTPDLPKQRDRAFALLAEANQRAPHYVRWYLTQPGTLARLREDERLAPYLAEAIAELQRLRAAAPDDERVSQVLDIAEKDADARPGQQSSRAAISLQVLTLAGTLVLLL